MLYNCIIFTAGLLSSFFLFSKFPVLKKGSKENLPYTVSIIIPARNEEENLSLLLRDLTEQQAEIYEIICVDDCSNDKTCEVATSFGVTTLSAENKPQGWIGKSWACQTGATSASGDILLFIDADVRLSPEAVSNLISAYDENKCTISVQPFHKTKKHFEQFSFFFNLIQIAGNGTCMRFLQRSVGLYGPVIVIDKPTYDAIGGHSAIKKSIVDDVALGEKLRQEGFSFKLFTGGADISFRMYQTNLKALYQGWTKNIATGAMKADSPVFLLTFIWITSVTACFVFLIDSAVSLESTAILLAIVFYICWVLELSRISYKLGTFKKTTILFYPVYLSLFILIFFVSLFKKLFHKNVQWKGRNIPLD